MVEDIKDAWPVFIVILGISIIICFIFYYLLENCAWIMIMIMLFGSLAALAGFGVFSWYKYKALEDESVYNKELADNYKTTAIVFWVLAGIFFILVCCLVSRIKLAAKMIAAAADFLTDIKSTLLVPIILTGILCVFTIFWSISFTYLFSVGNLRYDEGDIFGDMTWTDEVKAGIYLMIFALLWYISFTLSTNIFVIATLTTGWYFGRFDNYHISMITAFKWAWFYHLGTLAFGSFLIALLWAIQLILTYIYQKLKETGDNNFCLKCTICFVNCFERVMRYLNQHAYIEVVLKNLNYCSAAASCLEVITSNFLRFAVLTGLVNLFLVLGSIMISVVVTIIGHFILKTYGNMLNIEFETIGPLVLIFTISMVVSLLFNNIFEISADTMLHCYVQDEKENNLKGRSANKVPDKIRDLVNETNPHRQLIDQANNA